MRFQEIQLRRGSVPGWRQPQQLPHESLLLPEPGDVQHHHHYDIDGDEDEDQRDGDDDGGDGSETPGHCFDHCSP